MQIVLIDRSKGTNNGDFDIEFNYGNGGADPVPPVDTESNPNAAGFQGFKLGPEFPRSDDRSIRSVRHQRRADSLLLPRWQAASELQLTSRQ